MEAEDEQAGWSREEVFMALLMAVLVPAMVIATNFDLRSQVKQAPQQFSKADSVRIWLTPSKIFDTGLEGEIKAAPQASNVAVLPTQAGRTGKYPASPSDAIPAGGKRELSLMSIDFNLAEPTAAGAALQAETHRALTVKKPIYAGDRLIGNLDITIAREGELLLDAQEVRAIMGQQVARESQSSPPLPGQGLVSFASLREIGIDLRYSPHEDVIRLNP